MGNYFNPLLKSRFAHLNYNVNPDYNNVLNFNVLSINSLADLNRFLLEPYKFGYTPPSMLSLITSPNFSSLWDFLLNPEYNLDKFKSLLNELVSSFKKKNNLEGEIPHDKKPSVDVKYSNLTGLGKWGDLGVEAGLMVGAAIGGKAGNAISRAATGTETTINAIKNLKALKGVEGGGMAKAGNIAAIAGAVAGVADAFLEDKTEYEGKYGNVTLGLDTLYDGISDAAMTMGPWGALVGGAMKTMDLVGDGLNNLGIGTDGLTVLDSILGSSFFNWNIGLANSIGARKTDSMTKDNEAFATVGSSYTGTNSLVDDAVSKANKKYGNFSFSAFKKAQNSIREANRQQAIIQDISGTAQDRFNIRNSMSATYGNKREFNLMGGYNLANILVGKLGMKFSISIEGSLPKLAKILGSLPEIFKLGGELPKVKILLIGGDIPTSKYLLFIETLPENLKPKDGDLYDMLKAWTLWGKPKHFNDVKGIHIIYDKLDKLWHAPSVAYDENKDEYIFLKSSLHPTYNKELEWYFSNDPEAVEFRSKYRYDPISNKYLPIVPKSMLFMKNGGEFNVIPDGSLHKNLHHMDIDGITKKGIPVIDTNGELTAEIEREEIILRLTVTEKLEKLNKIYLSSDSKKKEKEDAALEAGKLLVYEILNNTIDNTNLIDKV